MVKITDLGVYFSAALQAQLAAAAEEVDAEVEAAAVV